MCKTTCMSQVFAYPFDLARDWLSTFLGTHPTAQALLCRAVAVTPDVLQEAQQRPQRLSRTQWEILRQSTRGSSAWSRISSQAEAAGHLESLTKAMRAQHNRTPRGLVELRLRNLQALTTPRGAVVKVAELLGVTYQGISQLNTGHNVLGTHKARSLEGALGLPVGWFDQDEPSVPAATLELLATSVREGHARKVGIPTPGRAVAPASEGLPQLSSPH